MSDDQKDTDFDLDEDLFGFDMPSEAIAPPEEDEEDLEAIFAAFQEEEERERAAREAKRAEEQQSEELARAETVQAAETASAAPPAVDEAAPLPATATAPLPSSAPAAPTAPVLVAPSGSLAGISKGLGVVLVALLLMNAMIAFVALRDSSTTRRDLIDVQRSLADSVRGLRDAPIVSEPEDSEPEVDPIVPPNVENHPVFEQSIRDIEEGQYAKARQRLYAFLAVVDRLEDTQRSKAESKAQYLLARATHLEALQSLEEAR